MNRIFYILLFLSFCTTGRATHNRAGQILYRHISGYTYEFTITVFYYSLSPATKQRIDQGLPVSWGDNSTSQIPCIQKEIETLPDDYTKCIFRTSHTFPGPGVYSIVMADPNRNVGIVNIPYSDNVVFSVKTIFKIDPNFLANNAPELLTYPIDRAALGQVFIHNPSAYDIDGDSLSYELAICTRERGVEIENYSYPEASDSLVVNAVTGDLIWASPVKAGKYNVAMKINEWRSGVKIGSIARDMQIEVVDSKNRPPVLPDFPPVCVEAGTKISLSIHVTDPDNDRVVLTATGGPFQMTTDAAELKTTNSQPGFMDAVFSWQTNAGHVRKQPYVVLFKAEDQNSEVKLVSFATFNITVLAPKVKNFTAAAGKKSIMLHWNPTECTYAAGYEVYRSIGSNTFEIDSCAGGIPAGSGYEKIAAVNGIANTDFEDTNGGKGLSPGINYCYRIVVYFSDGAKGFPSEESCAVLLGGTPPMIRADAETIDAAAGVVNVAWLQKPIEDKLVGKTGPFEYRLYFTNDMNANNWTLLDTKSFGDTTYTHSSIDTKTKYPYYYKVELWDTDPANTGLVDDFETASTLYPVLQPSDQSVIVTFGRYTPWLNTEYEIYRCAGSGADLCDPVDLVGRTNRETYTDAGLKNGQKYCYRIKSFGYRNTDVGIFNNQNWSHVACVTPVDNVPPCAPELSGHSVCAESRNVLDWTYEAISDTTCMEDVEKYRIYFSIDNKQPYVKIDSVMNRDTRTWSHKGTMKGCYYVTAVDSAGNASQGSNIICLDECGAYALPNVFTPNGDNINDIFKSYNPSGISKVDMKIFNRWGKLVFKTSDADINWDGRDIDSKKFAPSGVYYYTCDVYEERLTGSQIVSLSGFIHLYYGKDAQPYVE